MPARFLGRGFLVYSFLIVLCQIYVYFLYNANFTIEKWVLPPLEGFQFLGCHGPIFSTFHALDGFLPSRYRLAPPAMPVHGPGTPGEYQGIRGKFLPSVVAVPKPPTFHLAELPYLSTPCWPYLSHPNSFCASSNDRTTMYR